MEKKSTKGGGEGKTRFFSLDGFGLNPLLHTVSLIHSKPLMVIFIGI